MANAQTLSKRVGAVLRKKKRTLSLAESCTGGYISHAITSVAGSSAYFMGSVVSYDNKIKTGLLSVKPSTLKKHGAVSAECVAEMALGALKKFGTDFALATSGIAGPTGAVPGKPVGTVYIALATKKGVRAERFAFKGKRLRVIQQAAEQSLKMLLASL